MAHLVVSAPQHGSGLNLSLFGTNDHYQEGVCSVQRFSTMAFIFKVIQLGICHRTAKMPLVVSQICWSAQGEIYSIRERLNTDSRQVCNKCSAADLLIWTKIREDGVVLNKKFNYYCIFKTVGDLSLLQIGYRRAAGVHSRQCSRFMIRTMCSKITYICDIDVTQISHEELMGWALIQYKHVILPV